MVGFVVIGRNEASRIAACIASIGDAGPVVYADSASSDDSVATAKAAGAFVVELDPGRPLGAARGRKEGFDALITRYPETEYVQFVDGDCTMETGWIDAAREFLRSHPDIAVVCGRRREVDPTSSLYNLMIDREWNTPVGEAGASGGDSMMRVAAVREAGGFNEKMMAGEEPELAARMRQNGWRIWRVEQPMTVHDANIHRLSQWLRRAKRSGMGYAQAYRATRFADDPLYMREIRSALLWTFAVPGVVVMLAVMFGWKIILLLPVIYLAQVARIASRSDITDLSNWKAATVTLISKVPESLGALSVMLKPVSARSVEYKDAG